MHLISCFPHLYETLYASWYLNPIWFACPTGSGFKNDAGEYVNVTSATRHHIYINVHWTRVYDTRSLSVRHIRYC